jgi:glucan phosphoethanolaminetransferase (alkaline phosphatase superfamily)
LQELQEQNMTTDKLSSLFYLGLVLAVVAITAPVRKRNIYPGMDAPTRRILLITSIVVMIVTAFLWFFATDRHRR